MDAWALFWFRWLPALALLAFAAGAARRAWRGAARPGLGELPRPPRGPGLPGVGPAARWLAQCGLATSGPLHWLCRQALFLGLALLFLFHLGLAWPGLGRAGAWWRPALAAGGPLAAGAAYALLLRRLATPWLRRFTTPADYLWPLLGLAVLASGLGLARLSDPDLPAWPLAPGAAPGPALALHLLLGWGGLALWPWTRWGLGLEALARRLRRAGPPALPPEPATPPAWETGRPADYQAWLQARWAGAGVHQVLGAAQRNLSAPVLPPGAGEGGHGV